MKQTVKLILFIAMLCVFGQTAHAAAPVSLNINTVNLDLASKTNKKTTIKILKQKDISVKKIAWRSKNKKVAGVSKHGVVKAKHTGKTTIIATVKYKKSNKTITKKLTCKVVVKNNYITLNKSKVTLEAGGTFTLKLNNAKNKSIEWSIDDRSVIEFVKAKGNATVIKALAEGEAVITVKCEGKKYICRVIVEDPDNKNSDKNEHTQSPFLYEDNVIQDNESDENIIAPDNNKNVSNEKNTTETQNELSDSSNDITENNKEININVVDKTVMSGETFTLRLDNAKYKKMKWHIEDAYVLEFIKAEADIVEIKAIDEGKSQVTVECEGITYICNVTVITGKD